MPADLILADVCGDRITVCGKVETEISLGGWSAKHELIVAEVTNSMILGADFLNMVEGKLDFARQHLNIGDTVVPFSNPWHKVKPRVAKAVRFAVEPETVKCSEVKDSELPPILMEVWEKNCEGLGPEDRQRFKELLIRHVAAFALHDGDLGRTGLVKHTIDTGKAQPIRLPPRRMPQATRDLARQELEKMKQAGIIEPADGPWSACIVMVPKSNGKMRVCVDYRSLNALTIKDSHPLPHIQDTLDSLSGAKWFCALDLQSGYWQVEIAEEDKPKTAFSFEGLWQFKVMPFGLCNAPATFERLMESVLRGMLHKGVLVYLDDVSIHATTLDEEFALLEEVLCRLEKANLKLNPKKCRFFSQEITFLGHRVSAEGIRPSEEKIKAVKNWPRPKSATEVRGFLGLCNYYRRMIEHHSDIALPLIRLTEKKAPFEWTEDCEKAFNELKNRLVEAPILQLPKEDLPFILDCDASLTSIGAVLQQVQDGKERVIAYFSQRLSKAEENYCVTRRELLAVVRAITHFRTYLLGRHFTLRVDHASLQWLCNFKDPDGQWARWLLRLQEYDYTIIHRPGKSHGNADALSRIPCGCAPCRRLVQREEQQGADCVCTQVNQVRVVDEEFGRKQREDKDLAPIISRLEASSTKPGWEEMSPYSSICKAYWKMWDVLELRDGVLYRKWEDEHEGTQLLLPVIPDNMKKTVLEELHNTSTAGHFGIRRTYQRLANRYFWVGRRADVERWCRQCYICASRKGPKQRKHAPGQICLVGSPMERVAVDIAGPLPETEQGNKYILVCIDYFTKWPEAYAIPDQEAETVASKLVNEFFTRFGAPISLHSDQGRTFESRVFQEVCTLFEVKKTRTTPYYPQSDGAVERLIRDLKNVLAKVVDENQRDWDKKLPFILMASRSAEHRATGYSPDVLMLGRHLRMPFDLCLPSPQPSENTVDGRFGEALQRDMRFAQETAREGLKSSALRVKQYYDRNADAELFKEGDAVLYLNLPKKKGQTPKLSRAWTGPFRVMKRIYEGVYKIQRSPRHKPKIVNRWSLWKYSGELSEDWWERAADQFHLPDVPRPPYDEDDRDNTERDLDVDEGDVEDDEPEEPEVVTTRTGRTIRKPRRLDL